MKNKELSGLLKKIAEKEEVTEFLIVLHGNFDQEVVTSSVKLIENKCKELAYSSSLTTRLKIISVEILQNISKHNKEYHDVYPYFIIGSNGIGVTIYSGNIVNNATKNVINDRLNVYNSLEGAQLKSFYRDSLKNTSISESGNAGIGLLDIVYRSNQPVDFSFHDYKDDLYYFGLNVNIKNT